MAALMGQNPESRANTALEEAIDSPGNDSQLQCREEVDVEGSVGQDSAVEDVTGNVEEGGDGRGVEAFLGNSIFEVFQIGNGVIFDFLRKVSMAFFFFSEAYTLVIHTTTVTIGSFLRSSVKVIFADYESHQISH